MITLSDISIKANDRSFFTGANWSIEDGQTWAVVGPTGAGKSLLTQVLTHRRPLSHGQITYFFDPEDSPQGRSYPHPGEILIFSAETHTAFLDQYASYYQARWQSLEGEENPTVRDYILSMRRRGNQITPDETQNNDIDFEISDKASDDLAESLPQTNYELLETLAIVPLLNRQVHLLSNGQSRKLFLASLLLSSPRVLILDDPYSGLDQASRMALSQTVENLIALGKPQVLFFTSRPEDVPGNVNDILGIRDGLIQFIAPRTDGLTQTRLSELFAPQDSATVPNKSSHDANPPYRKNYSADLAAMAKTYAKRMREKETAIPERLIEMENVSIRYGDNRVLDKINWQVNRGERWLVSGPNGAGKSTLLSLVMADNPQAYANRVSLFGQRRGYGASIWEIKRAIGYVSPELQAFYATPSLDRPVYTCQQVAISGFFDSIGLFRRPTPEQNKAAFDWLEALGMAEQANVPFSGLSNGQKRITLLARALVKHPPLLVLDEPCQSLDIEHRQIFTRLVDSLCVSTTLTLIYVTHDSAESPSAITHRLKLDQGRVIKIERM